MGQKQQLDRNLRHNYTVSFRTVEENKELWATEAEFEHKKLAEWMRDTLNNTAKASRAARNARRAKEREEAGR